METLFDISGETATLVKPNIICNDAGTRCEDCPVINPTPPSQSDCPSFELLSGEPFCTKEDQSRRQLEGTTKSTGVNDIAFPNLVTLIEIDQSLTQAIG